MAMKLQLTRLALLMIGSGIGGNIEKYVDTLLFGQLA
jgi:hypothetical protein